MEARHLPSVKRLRGLALAVALAVFYVTFGHEWFFNGRLAICVGEEVNDPSSWCYQPQPPAPATPNQVIASSLASIDSNYAGMHRFFGDDIIGQLFESIARLPLTFVLLVAPYWNAFFRSDPQRIAFGIVVGVFYAALVKKVIDQVVDWMHGK